MGRLALVGATAVALLLMGGSADAAELTVTSTRDAVDASVGDGRCAAAEAGGQCTLRAAVQEADAANGATTISVPAGRYVLAIAPAPEAGSASDVDPANGDLDLTADIALRGAGVGRTIIDGGGIDRVFETGSDVTAQLRDLTVTGGDSTAGGSQEIDLGGGILNKSGITLERVELVGNRADGGGGMFSIPGTMPVVRDSLIAGNSAVSGGGLRIDHGATIVNTTITGNVLRPVPPEDIGRKPVSAVVPAVDEISGWGGGIDHRGGADLTIVNSTIAGNHAVKGGGGLGAGQGYAPLSDQAPLGHLILHNTIIAGNTSDAGPLDCRTNQVEFRSLGHNLDSDGTCFLTGKRDRPKTDPLLGALNDNGGPTRTLALRAGSPAIDAGDDAACPKADQRGTARPQGPACDIGAFEAIANAGGGAAGRACASRRTMTLTLPRGARHVRLTVGGRARRALPRGRKLVVSFRGRPRSAVRLVITARVAGGRRYVRRTTIHPCTARP